MPKKRKRQSDAPQKAAARNDPWFGILLTEKAREQIQSFVQELSKKKPSKNTTKAALRIQRRVESDLQLPHVDVERIASCLCDPEALQDLLERLYVQTEKARKVFALLDHAGKGVVVLEDLQTVLSNDQVLQNEVGDDNLEEMMQAVDTSGDGLLTCDDMIRIARTVGL